MPETSPASTFGNYRTIERIGEGAERYVFRAMAISTDAKVSSGEEVALHVLRDRDPGMFKREAEILSSLDHPNIMRYRDSFDGRDPYGVVFCLVTELLEGETLKERLAKPQYLHGFPWEEARAMVTQILQALRYASKKGVVHRDLKPSNIFLTNTGVAKLIDFGIARRYRDGDLTASTAGAKGSFDWMAPDFALPPHKEFRGDEISDVFSFGVCLFQILTGKLPFESLGGDEIHYHLRWRGDRLPKADFDRHKTFRVLTGASDSGSDRDEGDCSARGCVSKCLAVDRKVRFKCFDDVAARFSLIQPTRVSHGNDVYEFVEHLGKGGFGEVFRARHLRNGRDLGDVAVKRLLQARFVKRFELEVRTLRDKAHPHLVKYHDFIEQECGLAGAPVLFLVIEYLAGMPEASLRDRIKASPSGLDPVEMLRLFVGYLDCLDHLHRQGIIHRDIKPGNLYAPPGEPEKGKVFDLGIAHDTEGTRTHGQVPGTLDYMPPEFVTQEKGRGSPQSDIYSLGVTLYYALTKSLPFPRLPGKDSEAWAELFKRAETPVQCLFKHPVFDEHADLISLLRIALAQDPSQRYPSAGLMNAEIQGILGKWERARIQFETAVAAAQKALGQRDYIEAERQADLARKLKPGDRPSEHLLAQIQEARQNAYVVVASAAQAALKAENFQEAEQQAARALDLRPDDPPMLKLRSQAEEGLARKRAYETAMVASQDALNRKDFKDARRQAERALDLWREDLAAAKLLSEAQKGGREQEARSQAGSWLTYHYLEGQKATYEQETNSKNTGGIGETQTWPRDATPPTRSMDSEKIEEIEREVRSLPPKPDLEDSHGPGSVPNSPGQKGRPSTPQPGKESPNAALSPVNEPIPISKSEPIDMRKPRASFVVITAGVVVAVAVLMTGLYLWKTRMLPPQLSVVSLQPAQAAVRSGTEMSWVLAVMGGSSDVAAKLSAKPLTPSLIAQDGLRIEPKGSRFLLSAHSAVTRQGGRAEVEITADVKGGKRLRTNLFFKVLAPPTITLVGDPLISLPADVEEIKRSFIIEDGETAAADAAFSCKVEPPEAMAFEATHTGFNGMITLARKTQRSGSATLIVHASGGGGSTEARFEVNILPLPAFRVFGPADSIIVPGQRSVRIPCWISDSTTLVKTSSDQTCLPNGNIDLELGHDPHAKTNAFLVLKPVRGYAGNVVVDLVGSAKGFASVNTRIRVQIQARIAPPTISGLQDLVLHSGERKSVEVTLDNIDFEADKLRLRLVVSPENLVSFEISGTGARRIVTFKAIAEGVADVSMSVSAPNEASITVDCRISILPPTTPAAVPK